MKMFQHPKVPLTIGMTLSLASVTLLTIRSGSAQVSGALPPYVRLQAATPGSSQVGHMNITGTAILGGFRLGVSSVPGYVLTANSLGEGTWMAPPATHWAASGGNIYNTNSGRVGIGTTSPAMNLHLRPPGANATLTGIRIDLTGQADGSPNSLLLGVDGPMFQGSAFLDTASSGVAALTPLSLRTGSLERVRVTADGRVGVGTSTPDGALDVMGNLHLTGSRTKIFYRGDGDNQIGSLGVFGFNGGQTLVLDPGNASGGNLLTSEIRMGGFGNFNNNSVSLSVSNRLSVNSLIDPTVRFRSDDHAVDGTAIFGLAPNGSEAYGVWGRSTDGVGVAGYGDASGSAGVLGDAMGDFVTGVLGIALGAEAVGVVGVTDDFEFGYGVYSQGDLGSDGIKYFHIDHPLDPANKVLNHACAEGPDPLNIYGGNVLLDGSGRATVVLPAYFDALNKDFRYTLTPIGGSAPDLHVSREIEGGAFQIGGGRPRQKVSWRVEGVRNDLYAQRYRKAVEVPKSASEKGRYLHPELYGRGPESALWRGRKAIPTKGRKSTSAITRGQP